MKYLAIIMLFCSCIPLEHAQNGIGGALERAQIKAGDTTTVHHIPTRWTWRSQVDSIHINCKHP